MILKVLVMLAVVPVFDDVEDLRIEGLEAPQADGAAAPIRFTRVRDSVKASTLASRDPWNGTYT
jgi:hypothetical protein